MRGVCLTLLALTGSIITPGVQSDDTIETLVLLQMIQQRDNGAAQQSLFPLLLTSLMGKDDDDVDSSADQNKLFMLLLGAGGNNAELQQWLPLILTNDKNDKDDKLLMMLFMQQNQVTGNTDSSSLFPLLLLNGNDDKFCEIKTIFDGTETDDKCFCEKDNSQILLYMMMFSPSSQNPMSNFMFMLFNDDTCKGSSQYDNSACECTKTEKIEGGIDLITYMMLMQMNPVVQNNLPQAPPQRAIDARQLIKSQLFQNLGPEYAWMANVGDADIGDLVKFQLYKQMGIPPSVMGLLSQGGAQNEEEKFALVQYMAQFSDMNIETTSLMLGIEDSKQFFVHRMIEQGQVDPLTASMLLASTGDVDKAKMKEMLVLAATGQVDPETFATIAKPYVPELPQGVYPGMDLYFIHLELLGVSTCGLIKPDDRKACGSNFGSYITAEQCEVQPYCCYNPYFGEVNNVPWCYYNVFFVFHDQYKLRVREADKFKGPADCPGLFRYGLNLDPFLYKKAISELEMDTAGYGNYQVAYSDATIGNTKLAKLIHMRRDLAYEGVSEFHCRAILGGCWDDKKYPLEYGIPQCFVEERIFFANEDPNQNTLNLYDPKLFRPVVPEKYRSDIGECDTNYFKISTLYYERRACSYDAEMLKFGREFDPLSEPTREDCLFRLGCCYEEDEQVLSEYSFLPRCYKRTKDEDLDRRLYRMEYFREDGEKICGTADITRVLINDLFSSLSISGGSELFTSFNDEERNKFVKYDASEFQLEEGVTGEICLFKAKDNFEFPKSKEEFWTIFDVFPREYLIDQLDVEKIPLELREMALDLF